MNRQHRRRLFEARVFRRLLDNFQWLGRPEDLAALRGMFNRLNDGDNFTRRHNPPKPTVYSQLTWSYDNLEAIAPVTPDNEQHVSGDTTISPKITRKRKNLTIGLRDRELGMQRGSKRFKIDSKLQSCPQTQYLRTTGLQRDVEENVRGRLIQETPFHLRQRRYQLGECNKVFAAQWLDEHNALLATKCNSLVHLNLRTGNYRKIPLLSVSKDALQPPPCSCGIHAVELNPSRGFAATCASSSNHVAVYNLRPGAFPQPYCVLEGPHKDYLFDLCWLDEQRVASVSRDTRLAIHCIPDTPDAADTLENGGLGYAVRRHVAEAFGGSEDRKFRAVEAIMEHQTLAVIALDGWLALYDPTRLAKPCNVFSLRPCASETVCLRKDPEHPHVLAVGSQSSVTFYDIRSNDVVLRFRSESGDRGVRSLNFNGSVFTYGTGQGALFYYELRVNKHISIGQQPHSLSLSGAWLRRDDNFYDHFPAAAVDQPHAAYTHVYDVNRSRLLVAGGPLAAGLYGHAVNLWC